MTAGWVIGKDPGKSRILVKNQTDCAGTESPQRLPAMEDCGMYKNFGQLCLAEQPGVDYLIQVERRMSAIAIIAPHGGRIEPGTAEIARAVAGGSCSYYGFCGIKPQNNRRLHITSTRFDEPVCLDLIRRSRIVVTLHGCRGGESTVCVGGRHEELKLRIIDALKRSGFRTVTAVRGQTGRHPHNLCNRVNSGRGLQLEISRGLRAEMVDAFDGNAPCGAGGEKLDAFARAVRSVLTEAGNLKPSGGPGGFPGPARG